VRLKVPVRKKMDEKAGPPASIVTGVVQKPSLSAVLVRPTDAGATRMHARG